ncbi:hypothetical protein GMOD_00001457 [Pyrenophora seminiperda CCB06]|uniref:Uncharacterized protein n=1 Tax=Pyrenophora seminiperda CCB06 TaxID=1302712 RepID=A0A3M7LZB7_9PLEO|nr:hypothetical protein GMOD_00001457 [Pyrenophora seminiperda CCB06]
MEILNNLLVSLGKHDLLNLKQYSKYPQLMSEVSICEEKPNEGESLRGAVAFQALATHILDFDATGRFKVDYHGLLPQWVNYKDCYFTELPLGALVRIDELLRTSTNDITFDLDTKKGYDLNMGLLNITKEISESMKYWSRRTHNDITVKMSTQSPYTDFNNFQAFREWSNIDVFATMVERDYRTRCCRIILNFNLPFPRAAKDIQIGIGDLFKIMYCDMDATIIIQGCDDNPVSPLQISWYDL